MTTRSDYRRILNEHLAPHGESTRLARALDVQTQMVSKWKRGEGPGPKYWPLLAEYFSDERLRTRTPDAPTALPAELARELRAALARALELLDRMEP